MPNLDTVSHHIPKHRLEALADGVFAVAMTLLVIELKLPESVHIQVESELVHAVAGMASKFISWVISFFVLAIYWHSHQRMFHRLRLVDGSLVGLTMGFLGCVSLLPFASSLSGQFVKAMLAQVLYSSVMLLMGVGALLCARYIHRHPELCGDSPMTLPSYRAARFRTLGLMAVALVAIVIARFIPGAGNMAFTLMFIISRLARRMEAAPG